MFKRSASGATLLVKEHRETDDGSKRSKEALHEKHATTGSPAKRVGFEDLHCQSPRCHRSVPSPLSSSRLKEACRPVASKKSAHLETVARQSLAGQGTAPPPSSCRASKRPSCLPAASVAYTLPRVGHGGAAGCTRNCRTRYRIKLRLSLSKPQSGLHRHAPFLSIVRFGWCVRARRGSRPPQRQGPNTEGLCRSPSSF